MNKKISPDFRSIARHLHQVFQDRKNREAAKLVQDEVVDFMEGSGENDIGVKGYVPHSNFYRYEEFHQPNPFDEDDHYW